MRNVIIEPIFTPKGEYIELDYSDCIGVFLELFSEKITKLDLDIQDNFAAILSSYRASEFIMKSLNLHYPEQFKLCGLELHL